MKLTLLKRFQRYFGTGLLILVPFSLTAYIIYQLFLAVDGILVNFVYEIIQNQLNNYGLDRPIPGLGIITLVILITGVGVIARNYFGKKLIELGEFIVSRLPLVNRIYITIQQISHAFFGEKREVFKKSVLFEYPRKGIYSIGFVTQDTKGIVQDNLDEDVVSVFLPTTPNPTSGFLLFVKKKEITMLDMTVEEALKLVISGGAIIPNKTGKGNAVELPEEQDTQLVVQ